MKWLVQMPDGEEIEEQGGSASDAVSNAIRRNLPPPTTDKDAPFTVKTKLKHPKMSGDEQWKTIYVTPYFYWSTSEWQRST